MPHEYFSLMLDTKSQIRIQLLQRLHSFISYTLGQDWIFCPLIEFCNFYGILKTNLGLSNIFYPKTVYFSTKIQFHFVIIFFIKIEFLAKIGLLPQCVFTEGFGAWTFFVLLTWEKREHLNQENTARFRVFFWLHWDIDYFLFQLWPIEKSFTIAKSQLFSLKMIF